MTRTPALVALAAAAALTAACTTPAYVSPVEVTRFIGSAPAQLGTGTITVLAAPSIDPRSLEYGVYQVAVSEELSRLGYTVGANPAAQVALVDVEQFVAGAEGRRGPVSVGVGGSAGSYGSGVGMGIGLDLSGKPRDRIDTQLSVSIRPAAGGQALWEGRARFTASDNSEYAAPEAAARRAAAALFRGFPGNSGETIEVE